MQDDIVEIRIPVVAVRVPAVAAQINLHVGRVRGFTADLDDRPAKVRPGLHILETRMKNPHRAAVQSHKLIPQQPLVLPDGLPQPLRRRGGGAFARTCLQSQAAARKICAATAAARLNEMILLAVGKI